MKITQKHLDTLKDSLIIVLRNAPHDERGHKLVDSLVQLTAEAARELKAEKRFEAEFTAAFNEARRTQGI